MNEVDIGWSPLTETWVQHRKSIAERKYLPSLFERYIETLQELTRRGYKEAYVPVEQIDMK
jgi:dynein heavy chain